MSSGNKISLRPLIVPVCLLLLVSGCKKIDRLTQFDMTLDNSVVVPSTTGINLPVNLITPEVETNSEKTFESNDTRKDLVEEIRLTTLDLTITSPSNSSFSFLRSISIYISAPGVSETRIAWKDSVPASAGPALALDVSPDDLKEYIKKDKYTLRVNTVTDELLTSNQYIDIHSAFFVNAKLIGNK
jgi:hypothetical protein